MKNPAFCYVSTFSWHNTYISALKIGLQRPIASKTLDSKLGFVGPGLIPQRLQAGTPHLNSPLLSPSFVFAHGLQFCSNSEGKSDKITD